MEKPPTPLSPSEMKEIADMAEVGYNIERLGDKLLELAVETELEDGAIKEAQKDYEELKKEQKSFDADYDFSNPLDNAEYKEFKRTADSLLEELRLSLERLQQVHQFSLEANEQITKKLEKLKESRRSLLAYQNQRKDEKTSL